MTRQANCPVCASTHHQDEMKSWFKEVQKPVSGMGPRYSQTVFGLWACTDCHVVVYRPEWTEEKYG